MSWIIVIEENQSFLKNITEALEQVDPKTLVVSFPDSAHFMKWMSLLAAHDEATVAQLPKDKFRGVITAIESWNFRDIRLIEKFRPLFVQRGFATSEQEICVVLTGYDTPQLDKKRYEQRSVNNFIYKPFDKLLLKQMVEIAFSGRHPVKNYYVHNLKTDMQIEMLKEIRMTEVSEIGFQTVADKKVEGSRIAKYYADFLETNQHRSALGRAFQVGEIPQTQHWRVGMGFFALDQQQSFNLQKLIQPKKQTRLLPGTQGLAEKYEMVFIQGEHTDLCQQLLPSIERFFDHKITILKSFSESVAYFKACKENKSVGRKLVFIDMNPIFGNEVAELESLLKIADGIPVTLYALSPRIFPEVLESELSKVVEDIYYSPFNRSYIIKTLKRRWTDLRNKEEIFEIYTAMDQLIHVSNPVKLVEVNEAGVTIEYERAISIGGFREFIFWLPNEIDTPELMGQCNYTEYMPEKKVHHCHFIFFGLRDTQLKHMRLWMLHNYIENKSEES